MIVLIGFKVWIHYVFVLNVSFRSSHAGRLRRHIIEYIYYPAPLCGADAVHCKRAATSESRMSLWVIEWLDKTYWSHKMPLMAINAFEGLNGLQCLKVHAVWGKHLMTQWHISIMAHGSIRARTQAIAWLISPVAHESRRVRTWKLRLWKIISSCCSEYLRASWSASCQSPAQ